MSKQEEVKAQRADTMVCPRCDKNIVPQWTNLGRKLKWKRADERIETFNTARLCPLCGVDVDRGVIHDSSRSIEYGSRLDSGLHWVEAFGIVAFRTFKPLLARMIRLAAPFLLMIYGLMLAASGESVLGYALAIGGLAWLVWTASKRKKRQGG